MRQRIYWKESATIALAATLWILPAAARADVKWVAETSVENGPDGAGKTNVTIYLKGQQARRENADGTVTLIDLEKKKVFTLDPSAKTYYEKGLKENSDTTIEGLPSFLKASTSLKMKDEKTTDKMATKTADGAAGGDVTLTQQSVTGKVSIHPDFSAGGPGGGGGFPGGSGGGFPGGGPPGGGGGGFPGGGPPGGGGGGFPGGGPGGGGPPGGGMPEIKINGVVYTADAATLGIDSKTRDLITIFAAPMLPAQAPFASALGKEFAKKLTVPLRSRLTVEMPGMPGDGNPDGSTPDANAPPPSQKVTVIVHTTTLDTKTTLDDTLFTIPTDYKETQPPAPKRPQMRP